MKNLIFISLALSLIFLPACMTGKRKRKGVETSQNEKNKAYDKIILYADKKDEKTKKIEDQIRDRLVKVKTPKNKKPEVLTVSSSKELKESVSLEDRALIINLDSPQKKTLEQEDPSFKEKQSDPIKTGEEKTDLLIPSQTDFKEEQTQSDDTEMISAIIGSVLGAGALAYNGRQRYKKKKKDKTKSFPQSGASSRKGLKDVSTRPFKTPEPLAKKRTNDSKAIQKDDSAGSSHVILESFSVDSFSTNPLTQAKKTLLSFPNRASPTQEGVVKGVVEVVPHSEVPLDTRLETVARLRAQISSVENTLAQKDQINKIENEKVLVDLKEKLSKNPEEIALIKIQALQRGRKARQQARKEGLLPIDPENMATKIKELHEYQLWEKDKWQRTFENRFDQKIKGKEFYQSEIKNGQETIQKIDYKPVYQNGPKKGQEIPNPKKAVFLYAEADHNNFFNGLTKGDKALMGMLAQDHEIIFRRVSSVDDMSKFFKGNSDIDFLTIGAHGSQHGMHLSSNGEITKSSFSSGNELTENLNKSLKEDARIFLNSCSQGVPGTDENMASAFNRWTGRPVLAPSSSIRGMEYDMFSPFQVTSLDSGLFGMNMKGDLGPKSNSHYAFKNPIGIMRRARLIEGYKKIEANPEYSQYFNLATNRALDDTYFDYETNEWKKLADDASQETLMARADFMLKNINLYSNTIQKKIIDIKLHKHLLVESLDEKTLKVLEELRLTTTIKRIRNRVKKDMLFNETTEDQLKNLENLRNLEEQDLSNIPLSNISSLKGLENLKKLDLSVTLVSNISSLENLRNLKELHLSGTQVSEISSLQNLRNLEELYLSNIPLSNISSLKGLENLKRLDLSGTQVSNISSLNDLENLDFLDLSYTKITKEQINKFNTYRIEKGLAKVWVLGGG